MVEIKVTEEFSADADSVWRLLGDFGGIADWAPGIESCRLEGEGVGAVRHLEMQGGIAMQEKLESHDDGARSFSYSISGGPLPFQNYLATVSVNAEGAGCRVAWEARFDLPEGIPEDGVKTGVESAYSGTLKILKERLG